MGSEIIQFREMIEERIERKEEALAAIPDEHRPLIAKLTQERYVDLYPIVTLRLLQRFQTIMRWLTIAPSEKTLTALSKHIQQELLPAQDEDDEEACKEVQAALPIEVVESAVKGLAMRVNYGLDISRIPNAPTGGRIPSAWQVWRWEVKDEYREWLPKASREKALLRLAERQQVYLQFASSALS